MCISATSKVTKWRRRENDWYVIIIGRSECYSSYNHAPAYAGAAAPKAGAAGAGAGAVAAAPPN